MCAADWFSQPSRDAGAELPEDHNVWPDDWCREFPQLYRLISGNRVGDSPRLTGRISLYTRPSEVIVVLADRHLERVGFVNGRTPGQTLTQAEEELCKGLIRWKADESEARTVRGKFLSVD